MSGITIVLLVLLGLLAVLILVGFYLSGLVIKKKPADEEHIQNRLRETLPEGEWDTILNRYNACVKYPLKLASPYGYTIKGYAVCPHPESKKWVLLSHGVTVSKTRSLMYASMFEQLGFNYVVYDHRFHGENEGKNISYGFYERYDMKLLVDEIKKRFSPAIFGIHGESMGSGITLMYAGSVEDSADFYILDCPYDNFYEEARYQLSTMIRLPESLQNGLLRFTDFFIKLRSGFSLKDVVPSKYIGNIRNPMMIINCKGDLYIPPAMSQNLYDLKKEGFRKIYWVEKGDHAQAYTQDPEKYKREVSDFLQEILPSL